MPKVFHFVCFTALLISALAASAQVEVLYVTGPQASTVPLNTYNVNSETAVATQVGSMNVGGSSVTPVTVGAQHRIYVSNSTDVWLYVTDPQGVPASSPSQHLTFNFPHPVTSFVVDPKGNFAYAASIWFDKQYNNYAAVVQFTINQSTGKLTNTRKDVATYGPDPYTQLNYFIFGAGGNRLYASYSDYGPQTCIIGYDYYDVNPANGSLGPADSLFHAQADCSSDGAVAITDQVTAFDAACCGSGSGYVNANQTATGRPALCDASVDTYCQDVVYGLAIDPASQNLFFSDGDKLLTYVMHLDFADFKLIGTGSVIAGNPHIYFSPDSQIVYALNPTDIGTYTFQPGSGTLGASSSIAQGNNVSIATATLK
jgi:hypothetical protein